MSNDGESFEITIFVRRLVRLEIEATDFEIQRLKDRIQALETENELFRQERNKLKVIFDRALDAIVVFDKDANFKDVNEAACAMFELSKEELVTRNIRDFLILVDECTIANQLKSLEVNGSLSEELIVTLDNGKVKIIEFDAKRHVFENGFDLSIMRDVTSKKALEKEGLVNEQMFKDVFNRSPDGIILIDELGNFIDVNPSFCKSLVMEKCDLINYSLEQLIDPSCGYKINKLKHLLQKNGRAQGDLPIITKDGRKKIFEFTATANTYNNLYMCILRDNTEKRMMEEELRKSEERFRDMFEYALDAIIIWDDDHNIMRANGSSSRTFELSVEELLTHNLMDFIKNNQDAQSIYDELYEQGQIRAELPFYMPNGEVKHLEFTSKKHVIDGYNMTAYRNVTERKRMEKELRESELKFRKIFDTVMDGIVLLNDNYKIIAINPVAATILEVCEVSCIGKKLTEIIITKDSKMAEGLFNNQMQQRGEKIFVLYNGTEKILEFACRKQIIPNVHMALFRDVTEKKELEERLRKSDTLSVVGELAAGIAHEIRNPMTALKGFIHLLQGSVKEDFSMYFDVITTELKRIEMIITEFLILAKPQALSYQSKDITKVMTDTIDLLKPQAILNNVQIISKLDEKLPYLYCEPNQLKQVFINIIKNSIEAMPKGGTIFVRIHQDEDQIIVSIRDEGCGIPKDKLKKLGEPFYTTKDRGTGLGLMVSYKIIEEHKGSIKVTSKIGVGSVFHITLPIETNMREV